MENFDIIYEFRLLAKKLQQDDRIVYLEQVKKKMDMDSPRRSWYDNSSISQNPR